MSTSLKSHSLQSLVIQSKSRTEPCVKKHTISNSESEDWNIIWGKEWAYRFFVLNHSSSYIGTSLTRLVKSKGVSDDPWYACLIGLSYQSTHIWTNSHFHPEDLRNTEATYGNSTLGKIAPHMNSDSILEVIICYRKYSENFDYLIDIWKYQQISIAVWITIFTSSYCTCPLLM